MSFRCASLDNFERPTDFIQFSYIRTQTYYYGYKNIYFQIFNDHDEITKFEYVN